MTIVNLFPESKPDDEQRLAAFDLSTSDFHTALRPGLSRAVNRSELAPPNAAGTDLYNDTFELLAQMLVVRKWRRVIIMGQPRLIHPDGKLQLALSSAHDVANPDHRVSPKTGHKGPATFRSLDTDGPRLQQPLPLPEWVENDTELPPKLKEAPLWFVLYEREGGLVLLSLGRPAGVDDSGRVVDWSDTIRITPLDGGVGDLSVLGPEEDGYFDVPVEPRD